MEDFVEANVNHGLEDSDITRLNQELNAMQIDLEDMASTMRLGEQTGGN